MRGNSSDLIDTLYRLSSQRSDEIMYALQTARCHLGLPFAIVSKISADDYEVLYADSEGDVLQVGSHFELGQTYCAMTMLVDDLVGIEHMSHSEYQGHPCFTAFGLESYLGIPLRVGGKRFGTLNFSGPKPLARQWTDADRNLLRVVARMIEAALERERAEEERTATLDRLRRAHDQLHAFAARTAHDLASPLRHIGHVLSWLEADAPDLSDEYRAYLDLAVNRCGKLEALVADLFEYSAATHRKDEVTQEPLAVIQSALDQLPPYPDKKIEVRGASLAIAVPPAALALVIRNLVGNAAKHHDRAQGSIVVDVQQVQDAVRITISDDGPGIEQLDRERIFLPYERGTTMATGSGLGLSAVRVAVESHDGTVRCVSHEPRGCKFVVDWPSAAQILKQAS